MTQNQLMSLAAVARRLDVPYSRALAAQRRGLLIPDAGVDRVSLYDAARLPEIRRILAGLTRPTLDVLARTAVMT